ncbi:MAG: Asp-tRNA(Asn)/Glu-tRNA(Gln) amidotransferase subunit GatB [Candidatus Wolfebacteria bacterium]|nr:Asp-tRNA(Asn)/Glu-tRNA(Gln) amidotransferase subunit GatB [Candidatus Wolfebacteria bacterium]
MSYKSTIGLEIHVELKTKSKMFCGCVNDPLEKNPNINICPICVGHPGTLPVINKEAVKKVLQLGMALNSYIPLKSKFDRKNYFYPDLPKGYQISQYDEPLCVGGFLAIGGKKVNLTRIHLEEDTARLIHSEKNDSSLVDFNRAGVPLMELVTEPDIENGKDATDFAKESQIILRYLDISDADMEKGQMRVEANISISKDKELGTKVEIKNLNSFRAVEEAIDFEIKRQEEVLESGKRVSQETRGWNEFKKETFPQRSKEEAHDYRYFPEPDLPPLDFSNPDFIDLDFIRRSLSELPQQKRERLAKEYALKAEQIEFLIGDKELAEFFEKTVSELLADNGQEKREEKIRLVFNYFSSDLQGLLKAESGDIRSLKITPENFADFVVMISSGEISSRIAKDLLKEMYINGLDPRSIIKDKEMSQISDEGELVKTIEEVISENPKATEDYKKKGEATLQFLIGQAMKKLKGRGNPQILKELFKNKL